MRQALLWNKLDNGKVQCRLCAHACIIGPGQAGQCGVRENHDGTLVSMVYGKLAAANLDPIEKKPLYHFLPQSTAFSIGTVGCNMGCRFCQNYTMSQRPRQGQPVTGQEVEPKDIVGAALDAGAASIAYTYSEPTVFFEMVRDTAMLAVKKNLKNVLVSNGFMSTECLDELAPYIHAANIDLKAFRNDFYKVQCSARLDPVLRNLKHIKSLGWWLEVTTLVIPGLNDSTEELTELASFIATELSSDTPWHVSRFHPTFYMVDRDPTPVQTLEKAERIGKEAGLRHIYVGNVHGHASNSTFCPSCGNVCIERSGFRVLSNTLEDSKCVECGEVIPGEW
ncbi:MAG: AmmeMemoRadiSam system radical SAM enzyme [Desulfovibrio sp.]|uniref:AmmeMemoRadiSam system radical SAM enzyme n=1 Tax=Desulfovibrio sp. 7SRBS1 TaxID=3378064 RepID=UPI003B3F6E4C